MICNILRLHYGLTHYGNHVTDLKKLINTQVFMLRSSVLKQALLQPDLCYEMVVNNRHVTPTPAMSFGTLSHLAVLQPEFLASSIALKPPNKGREYDKDEHGRFLLLQATCKKLIDMQCAIHRKENFRSLLEGEIEGEWCADLEGVKCVAHPDVVNKTILLDYKTTSQLTKNWPYKASDAGYDIQFAHYHQVLRANGIHIKKWYHLVQSTAFPYSAVLYKYSKHYIQHALSRWTDAIEVYKQIVSGEYPIGIGVEESIELGIKEDTDDHDIYDQIEKLWGSSQ